MIDVPAATSFDPNKLIQGIKWEKGVTIPPDLVAVLDVAYTASLYSNEGRPLRFALGVRLEGLKNELRLDPAMPLDVVNLRKLALCTNPERTSLGVSLDPPRLVSLAMRPSGQTAAAKGVIEIEVSDPGCVALRLGNQEVRFRRDRCELFESETEGSADYLRPLGCAEALARFIVKPPISTNGAGDRVIIYGNGQAPYVVDGDVWDKSAPKLEMHVRKYADWIVVRTLLRIAAAIKAHGHGGAILVLPQRGGVLPAGVTGGSRLSGGESWMVGMREYAYWLMHYLAAREDGLVLAAYDKPKGGVIAWATKMILPRLENADRAWRADATMVADLTRVDGALVLDVLGFPAGFAAKLKFDRKEVDPETEAFLEARGTRHNSMAAAVSAIDGATGIVVSQDGDVTAFRKVEGSTLTHRELPL